MRKINGKKAGKGFTIIELAVASSLLLVAVGITYTAWSSVIFNYNILQSHTDARQQVRQTSEKVFSDIMNSCYLFAGQTVTIEGIDFTVGGINEGSTNIIMAIPEGTTPQTYTVAGYYLQPDSSDPANPTANNLMRYSVSGVSPDVAGVPSSIDLASLSGGTTRKIAQYIDPNNFIFKIGDSGNSVEVKPLSRKQATGNQPPSIVKVEMTINIRNK